MSKEQNENPMLDLGKMMLKTTLQTAEIAAEQAAADKIAGEIKRLTLEMTTTHSPAVRMRNAIYIGALTAAQAAIIKELHDLMDKA